MQYYPCKHNPMCKDTFEHEEKFHSLERDMEDDFLESDPICSCGYPAYSCKCDKLEERDNALLQRLK